MKYGYFKVTTTCKPPFQLQLEATDSGKGRWRLWDLWWSNISEASTCAETLKYDREGAGEQTWSLMTDDISEQESNHICLSRNVRADEREIHSTYSEFDIDPINQRRTCGPSYRYSPLHLYGYLYGRIWAIRHGGSVRYTFKSEVFRWSHVAAIDSSYR